MKTITLEGTKAEKNYKGCGDAYVVFSAAGEPMEIHYTDEGFSCARLMAGDAAKKIGGRAERGMVSAWEFNILTAYESAMINR
jgi:hypothetical protein